MTLPAHPCMRDADSRSLTSQDGCCLASETALNSLVQHCTPILLGVVGSVTVLILWMEKGSRSPAHQAARLGTRGCGLA